MRRPSEVGEAPLCSWIAFDQPLACPLPLQSCMENIMGPVNHICLFVVFALTLLWRLQKLPGCSRKPHTGAELERADGPAAAADCHQPQRAWRGHVLWVSDVTTSVVHSCDEDL